MTDDISKVARAIALEMRAHRVMGSRIEELSDWADRLESATTEKSVAMQYLEEKQADTMKQFHENYTESATPAEVAPIAWRFDYCGVKPMVWLEKPAENAPMFTNIRALVYADDYATLARQLAEAERQNKIMREADYHAAGVAQEQEIIELKSQLAKAKAENQEVLWSLVESQNARAHLLQRIAEAESALAEATRRLGEVEGLLRKWAALDAGAWNLNRYECEKSDLTIETKALLTKEPTK